MWASLLFAAYALFDVNELAYPAGSGEIGLLFTSGFAHFGLAHLLGNLAFLIVFGGAAEKKLHRGLFLGAAQLVL